MQPKSLPRRLSEPVLSSCRSLRIATQYPDMDSSTDQPLSTCQNKHRGWDCCRWNILLEGALIIETKTFNFPQKKTKKKDWVKGLDWWHSMLLCVISSAAWGGEWEIKFDYLRQAERRHYGGCCGTTLWAVLYNSQIHIKPLEVEVPLYKTNSKSGVVLNGNKLYPHLTYLEAFNKGNFKVVYVVLGYLKCLIQCKLQKTVCLYRKGKSVITAFFVLLEVFT